MASALPSNEVLTGTPNGAVVCVFCGSSPGTSPAHIAAAHALAQSLHRHSITLVYGGGTVGLMGELARTLVSLSGPESVHGIIPEALMAYEQAGRPAPSASTPKNGTTSAGSSNGSIDEKIYGRTTVVKDMHTRKGMMAQAVIDGGPGSGFVALAGGYGTLEELMEMVTWNQLGIHGRAIVVFNVEGYWDGLLEWVRRAVAEGFVAESNKGIMVEAREVEEVISALTGYRVSEGRLGLDWGMG